MDPIVQTVISQWGLPGAIIIFLVYVIKRREDDIREERKALREALVLHEKFVKELQDSRLLELRNTLEIVGENKDNLIAFKSAQDMFLATFQSVLTDVRSILAQINTTGKGPT